MLSVSSLYAGDLADVAYCQSTARDVSGHGLILVGPGEAEGSGEAGHPAGVLRRRSRGV